MHNEAHATVMCVDKIWSDYMYNDNKIPTRNAFSEAVRYLEMPTRSN